MRDVGVLNRRMNSIALALNRGDDRRQVSVTRSRRCDGRRHTGRYGDRHVTGCGASSAPNAASNLVQRIAQASRRPRVGDEEADDAIRREGGHHSSRRLYSSRASQAFSRQIHSSCWSRASSVLRSGCASLHLTGQADARWPHRARGRDRAERNTIPGREASRPTRRRRTTPRCREQA